jgi:nucleoside-diphosphate-sugar epimerase
MADAPIVLAGATGALGGRVVRALLARGADVRAMVRATTAREEVDALASRGVEVAVVDYGDVGSLGAACSDASCVVSALAGLRDVIVDAQSALLDAAVQAGVPRFVPSDYAIDFTKIPPGNNRNLDLRREFRARLDRAPIAATSILCGAFADMLTGQAPFVLFPMRRVLYWGSADQRMDFTTIDDTAAYTAAAALDPSSPRFLRIAGDSITARELAAIASELSGRTFRLLRGGSLERLDTLARLARAVQPARDALYPPWQGMQYMRDMYSGLGVLEPLDVDRYPGMRWTSVRDVLAAHLAHRRAIAARGEPRPT